MSATHQTTVNGNGQQLRDKVTFATNVPQKLTLEFDPPSEPRAGRFGDQYMYFFAGGKIAWFDPPVHAQIVASGAQAGEEIEICKRETRKGTRKTTAWEVSVCGAEDEPDWGAPHSEYDPDYAPDAKPPARREPAPVSKPSLSSAVPSGPVAQPLQAAAAASLTLGQALILAIDAVEEASRHAIKKHDWDEGLRLGEDAIVKLAITAFIQAQGGKQARI